MKFTLTHPIGMAVIRFRVNYKEIDRDQIYAFQTIGSPNVVVEGELTLNIVSAKANIEWEAVGNPFLAGALVVKYKEKSLLKDEQGEILMDGNGRSSKTLSDISLI